MPRKPSKNQESAEDYLQALSGCKKKKVNSRKKGVNFENKICKILNARFKTTDFMRSPGSGAFATTHNLPEHLRIYGDLITPKDFDFAIECKKGYNKVFIDDFFKKNSDLWKFWSQGTRDAKKSEKWPLIVWQQDNKTILAILDADYEPTSGYLNNTDIEPIRYKNILVYKLEDLLNITKDVYWFGVLPKNSV